jgi:peroxiredoxin
VRFAFLGLLAALAACTTTAQADGDAAGAGAAAGLIGRPAPGWSIARWINSKPLTLESLRGRVVLVRWFMSTECPYCSATAPSLRLLHERHAGRGLTIVGLYHHKRPEPLDPVAVEGWVRDFGFTFPVGIDEDWRTLKKWWLDGGSQRFTSVSFLIDKRGIVRHIHPGGSYAPDSADFAAMERWIERLIAE